MRLGSGSGFMWCTAPSELDVVAKAFVGRLNARDRDGAAILCPRVMVGESLTRWAPVVTLGLRRLDSLVNLNREQVIAAGFADHIEGVTTSSQTGLRVQVRAYALFDDGDEPAVIARAQ